MEEDVREVKDPTSGYASADLLDPESEVNEDHGDEGTGEWRDAMSGYGSADLLDREAEPNQPSRLPGAEERDPLAGYASADVLETLEDEPDS